MSHTGDPSTGCFSASYPSTAWLKIPCGEPNSSNPPAVGGGGASSDFSGQDLQGTYIGYSQGYFGSVSGITSETDTGFSNCSPPCYNFFSIQLNSNIYYPSQSVPCPNYPSYNGYTSGYNCWEQFVVRANGLAPAEFEIWYVLGGYQNSHGQNTCQAINHPPNAGNWFAGGVNNGDCYSESSVTNTLFAESVTNLVHLSVAASAAFTGSNNDEIVFCDWTQNPSCYSFSNYDYVLNLYRQWTVTEFNIFGYGSGSQAQFSGSGSSASITADLNEEQGNGNVINPSCYSYGYTGETNSLALVTNSCSTSPSGLMSFQESGYLLTTGISGCCGSVSPASGYYFGGPVTIKATPASGSYYFTGWTGSGSGSYTGSNNPQTITLGGPVTETAGFAHCCSPLP